jgi:glycosyltransferase involved in cell wall biosynthesis
MLVVCPYPQGTAAGQRLKYEQYFADWRAAGWEIEVSSYMDLAMWDVVWERGHLFAKAIGVLKGHARRLRDLLRIHRYDLVYLHMWATPFGTTLFERLIRALAKALVYDLEDNMLIGNAIGSQQRLLRRWLKGPGKARFLVRTADHVITSSPALNDLCLDLNAKKACTYISSSIDTDRFLPATPYANDQTVVIGWTGTFTTRPYLDLLRGVFQRLAAKHRFRLRVIGNFDYELPGVDLEVVRWNAEQEVAQLQAFDIGVYPLPADDWVLGKSGLKAIQYMAFALPIVATNVGNTPNLIRHGENGLLVNSEAEWEAALEQLLIDPALRRRLGEAARKDAVAHYSVNAIAQHYRAVIEAAQAGAG